MAIGAIHSGIMAGKLKGVMPATTPSGWRMEKESTSEPTSMEYSPFSRCGMPQANSTTSMPRVIEPLASSTVLPCSSVMALARASMSLSSSSLSLNIMRARRIGGVAIQAGEAALAAATAPRSSAAEAKSTSRIFSPSAGLKMSPRRPLVPATALPLM